MKSNIDVSEASTARRRRLRWTVGSAALTVLLMLAACAPVEEDAGPAGAEDDEGTDEAAPADPADAELDENATLRAATYVGPRSMDPHMASNATFMPELFPAFDRLIHRDRNGDFVPGLAEDWEWNDEVDVLTLYLREDVTFHDGEPFDAEAVAANFDRQMTHEDSTHNTQLADVETVEVIDELTVEYHLEEPNAGLVGRLSDAVGMMLSPAAFGEDLESYAGGTGMYQLESFSHDNEIIYSAYEDYWDQDAQLLAGLEISILSDARAMVNGLIGGNFDVAWVRDGSLLNEAENEGFRVNDQQTLEFQTIYANLEMEPFTDENFRHALNHAINRDGLVEAITRGWAHPMHQPFPDGYWANNPELEGNFEYDPDLAEEYLAEAEVEPEFTVLDIAGATPVGLTEALQSQLAEVGIEMDILVSEAGGQADIPYSQEAEVPAMAVEWVGRADPSMTVEQHLMPGNYFNPGDWEDDELAAAYRASIEAPDIEGRTQATHDLVEMIAERSLMFPLYSNVHQPVMTDRVVGLEDNWTAGIEFRGVGLTVED